MSLLHKSLLIFSPMGYISFIFGKAIFRIGYG